MLVVYPDFPGHLDVNLVPKLCLGTQYSAKLRFAINGVDYHISVPNTVWDGDIF